ncbi:hypothetical protein D3C87_1272490 [compost metagenome]
MTAGESTVRVELGDGEPETGVVPEEGPEAPDVPELPEVPEEPEPEDGALIVRCASAVLPRESGREAPPMAGAVNWFRAERSEAICSPRPS